MASRWSSSSFGRVRVLLASSLGGSGHLLPVAAFAQSCRRLGHEVLLVVPPSLAGQAESTGIAYRVGGEPPGSVVEGIWDRVRNAVGPDDDSSLIDRELFADRCTKSMLRALGDACSSFRPQLVVREPCEYASAVVAHLDGIAQAQVGISLAAIERRVLATVTPIIERYGRGVAEAIGAAPYFSSFPASLDPSPWPDTRRFHLPHSPGRAAPGTSDSAVAGAPADWLRADEDRPLVYVSFGTVIGNLPGAASIYRCALEAVAGLPARVLLTVGRTLDLDRIGPVPANARVERWVPQADVLGHAAVVVCHGGSGTTFGALTAGVPLVICPLFADQPSNGRLVESAGAGMVVAGRADGSGGVLGGLGSADVAPLRRAIERVLAEPSYRRAAQAIRAEVMATPTLDSVVGAHLAGKHLMTPLGPTANN